MKIFATVMLATVMVQVLAIEPDAYSVPQDTVPRNDTIIRSEREIELYSTLDSVNYFLGLTLGYSLEGISFKKDPALIAMGLYTAMMGNSEYTLPVAQAKVLEINERLLNEKLESAHPVPNDKLIEERNFLEENAKRNEVHTTQSGLQYEILTEGNGPRPSISDTVNVHYEGMFIDGTVFDSSFERGNPTLFPLSTVIAGWQEGLQLMPVGSTYKFYIPSKLAYGSRGVGPIPPYTPLVFRISLLGIQ
jgi:FKBP-type peptidyl-prolyl cis-trans isomerase FkpA